METNAWKHCSFTYPSHVPTMISPQEKQYLYWLGAEVWSGEGCIVEIGSWLGGSTVCLAAGMRDSGRDAHAMLKVYDNFIWRDFMARRAPLPLSAGEPFHPYFLDNVREYADIVDSYARALPDETIVNDAEAAAKRFTEADQIALFDGNIDHPVEIIFIDGAKSWRGISHLFRTLTGRFIPGKTLLVCQDFKYWGTHWVPMFMMTIQDYVEPVHNVLDSTTVSFLLKKSIPAEILISLPDHIAEVPRDRALRQIDAAADLLRHLGDPRGGNNVSLAKVSFLAHHGAPEAAVETFRSVERRWPLSLHPAQLDRARAYLRDEKGVRLRRPIRLRARSALSCLTAVFR